MKKLKNKFREFSIPNRKASKVMGGFGNPSATLDEAWTCKYYGGRTSTHESAGSARSACEADSECQGCYPD